MATKEQSTQVITPEMAKIPAGQINAFASKCKKCIVDCLSIVLILIGISICISSCSNNDILELPVTDNIHIDNTICYEDNDEIHVCYTDIPNIPFASDEELAPYIDYSCYEEIGVLSYIFARDYAFAEFYANINIYFPDEILQDLQLPEIESILSTITIADRPVVVYDYDDKPYYYEFPIIYQQDVVISTITVAAQPKTTELIAYMFPLPVKYDAFSFMYRRYVGDYPAVYYGNNGAFYKKQWIPDNEEIEIRLVAVDASHLTTNVYSAMTNWAASLSQEELQDINTDLLQQDSDDGNDYASLSDYIASFMYNNAACQSILLDKMSENIESSTDFELSATIQAWINENIQEINAQYTGFLSEYSSHQLRLTQWSDYCGPAILSWLYRGKYDSYNDKYLPLYGEMVDENYPRLYCYRDYYAYYFGPNNNESNSYETRRTHSESTDGGLYYAFFEETTEMFGEFPLFDGGLRRSVARATNDDYKIKFITNPITWIKNKHQPVVVEGILGKVHYWGAIGYAYNTTCLGIKKNMHIFVTDNGAYSEDHHNYPYWSILGGLNYAWNLNY